MAVLCGCRAVKAESFSAFGASGILSSQVGYDLAGSKRVLIRSEDPAFLDEGIAFHITDEVGDSVFEGHVKRWGSLWGSTWWVADFTALSREGTFQVHVAAKGQALASDPIFVGRNLLWRRCFNRVALEQLDVRAAQARTGRGFRDCGSDIQELSSHVVLVAGLCDILEHASGHLSNGEKDGILGHIVRGIDYIAFLQDLAKEQGLGDGAVVHEPRRLYTVTGDAAKAAMILAYAARIIQEKHPEKSREYMDRGVKAYRWIEANGPVMHDGELDFFAFTHGAPAGYGPPGQWMTRDLVMMMWAAVELFKAGRSEFKELAAAYAGAIMKRQVPETEREGPFYGHFHTFGGSPFTEKANIHCGWGDREGRKYNQGGHFPHYLLPFLEACRLWPDHPDADEWRGTLRDFAYGYFLPACGRSPFQILPAGYYQGEGLLFFSGWYHGHNGIYGHAAALALEFERFFDDPRFREIAAGNLLWIAGLNCGIEEKGRFVSYSMIYGVGHRYRGGWAGIPGTLCNGFDADGQFKITPPRAATDGPNVFTDEGYIVHAGGFLSGLARLPETIK